MRCLPKLSGAVAVAAVAVSTATSATAPVPVKASSRNDVTPVAGGEYFAWAKSRRRHPGLYDVWAQRGPEAPFQVNRRGTTGYAGGIDGTRLVYQQVRGGVQSDIRFFDLEMRRRSSPPAGVNTRRWEWTPSISGDWLLFGRGQTVAGSKQQIILQNLVTGEQRILDTLVSRRGFLEAGQVNGNYAVWTRCVTPSTGDMCDVFRYDISARTRTTMPRTGQFFYGASITSSGTVYYVRSSFGCGAGTELAKTTLDGTTFVLYSLPGGQDVSATYALLIPALPPTPETTRIYFERETCAGPRFDIYSLDDAQQAPPP